VRLGRELCKRSRSSTRICTLEDLEEPLAADADGVKELDAAAETEVLGKGRPASLWLWGTGSNGSTSSVSSSESMVIGADGPRRAELAGRVEVAGHAEESIERAGSAATAGAMCVWEACVSSCLG
jgi:hypothetical protein